MLEQCYPLALSLILAELVAVLVLLDLDEEIDKLALWRNFLLSNLCKTARAYTNNLLRFLCNFLSPNLCSAALSFCLYLWSDSIFRFLKLSKFQSSKNESFKM